MMDAGVINHESNKVKNVDRVYASDLIAAFNQYANSITTLSLDCFDTLLWRKAITPGDVFYDMQKLPAYQKHGLIAFARYQAEKQARVLGYIQKKAYEVTLPEIYRCVNPNLTEEEINELIEDELTAEINTCYAFPPMVELIRHAYAKGKKIIIVSNIYMKEKELRRLLTHTLPDDAMKMISNIFCSSDYMKPKSGGLFHEVLNALNFQERAILHIGDNQVEDLYSAKSAGLYALHLIQQESWTEEFFRSYAIAANMMIPNLRQNQSIPAPFRGVFATSNPPIQSPESIIGYMSLGPMMYAFSHFLSEHIKTFNQAGKKPKVLFLMRDAYLLSKAAEMVSESPVGTCVRISRVAAITASFKTRFDIERYLSAEGKNLDFQTACRQLMLPDDVANTIIETANASQNPKYIFIQQITQDDILQFIFRQASLYREKLKKYLRNTVGLMPGDHVLFVDLGYMATIQRLITPMLKEEMGIKEVYGCYFMSLNPYDCKLTHAGLIDASWCDYRCMLTLSTGAALLEEFCTSPDESVVDYSEEGEPIFSSSGTSKAQHSKVLHLQQECLRFVRDAHRFIQSCDMKLSLSMLREAALAEFARVIFLPTETELNYLRGFRHDEDLQTNANFCIFNDPNEELNSLRRQGLFFKNQHMFGLRSAGIELVLTLFLQRRLEFDVHLSDRNFRTESLLVVMLKDNQPQHFLYKATATHDGYFSCWIPVGKNETQLAILMGKNYQYVQIESIHLIRSEAYLMQGEGRSTEDIGSQVVFNHMTNKNNNLFECETNNASLMLSLGARSYDQGLRIVFRPVVMRQIE